MMSTLTFHALQPPIQAILTPAQRADATNDNHEPDRPMDFDEERGIWMWRYGRSSPRMVSFAELERIRAELLSESRIRRQRRGSVAARPQPQRGRPIIMAVADRIEHWPTISYVI